MTSRFAQIDCHSESYQHSHRIHLWNMCLHLVDVYGKLIGKYTIVPWILWDCLGFSYPSGCSSFIQSHVSLRLALWGAHHWASVDSFNSILHWFIWKMVGKHLGWGPLNNQPHIHPISLDIEGKCHQKFQVPKMEGLLNLLRLFRWVGFPYTILTYSNL